MNSQKKVKQKDGAIKREELYDQKQAARKQKDSKVKRICYMLNPKTIILIKKNKTAQQIKRTIEAFENCMDIKKKLKQYNYERG